LIWIIVLSILACYVVLTVCLLIIGSEADHQQEAIFTNRLANRSDDDVAHSLSIPEMPERMHWMPIQPQETLL
jgi:hypothetical protein